MRHTTLWQVGYKTRTFRSRAVQKKGAGDAQLCRCASWKNPNGGIGVKVAAA